MTDNSTIPVASGNETFANNDIGGIKYPRIKLAWGAPGSVNDASIANPIPVTGAITTLPALPAGTAHIGEVKIDPTQLGSLVSGAVPVVSGGYEYETVAAAQTDQSLGATGAAGDYLECLLCVVATAATSQVQIKDGAGSAITVLPNAVGAGVGTYPIPIGLTSTSGAWKVTTAAGVSVLASGNFT